MIRLPYRLFCTLLKKGAQFYYKKRKHIYSVLKKASPYFLIL